jgi:hypothetical protein
MGEEALDIAPVEDIAEPIAEAPTEEFVEEAPEPVSFSETQQKVFDDAIAKKVGKQRDAERQSEALRVELEQAKQAIPKPIRPDVPPPPDPYDDNYAAKLADRDAKMMDAAAFDGVERQNYNRQQAAEQQKAADANQVLVKKVEDYADRAKKLNIKPFDLQAAGVAVAKEQLHNDVVNHILDLDQGPAVTVYLANNPEILNELRQLPTGAAAVRISGEIREAALAGGSKAGAIPEPTESLRGAGTPEGKRGPKGATFQ